MISLYQYSYHVRPREEPQNVQQTHYINVMMKIYFAQPIADPITRLAEMMQNISNSDVFPVPESLSVLAATGNFYSLINYTLEK